MLTLSQLLHIVRFLGVPSELRSLGAAEVTGRSWQRLWRSDVLWQRLYLRRWAPRELQRQRSGPERAAATAASRSDLDFFGGTDECLPSMTGVTSSKVWAHGWEGPRAVMGRRARRGSLVRSGEGLGAAPCGVRVKKCVWKRRAVPEVQWKMKRHKCGL